MRITVKIRWEIYNAYLLNIHNVLKAFIQAHQNPINTRVKSVVRTTTKNHYHKNINRYKKKGISFKNLPHILQTQNKFIISIHNTFHSIYRDHLEILHTNITLDVLTIDRDYLKKKIKRNRQEFVFLTIFCFYCNLRR